MNTSFVQGESSTSSHFPYDVFLSFRGEDTRKNFTGHLYFRLCQVGLNTFKDDEKLRKGDVISANLEKAIEESKVSIVIFSKNYASSSWCLDELVKIIECKDKLKQVVLPIFYDVDPSQVRKQTGFFGDALAKHKERSLGAQRMEKWTTALTGAANLSGFDLQNVADGHESKFIERIIKEVLQEVNNQTPLDVACNPVGVDSRVKDVDLLLQSGLCVDEVRMIGIYGEGGIGKTTLAKAIYNRKFRDFSSSCFLSDVRSEAEADGLVKLQEKLLHQILKTKDFKISSVAEGVNLIKARLRSKKVLIVLDNVDHVRQLESLTREENWFGPGSLIIITTRDVHLLCGLRATDRYKAKLLNDCEALQLFSCHAFNRLFAPQEYVELAQDIIKYSGGLPLALVTLGSHLRARSVREWRCEIEKLKAIPHNDIQKILKISFDGLDDDTKSVFLDIACAFIGWAFKRNVIPALNACGFHSESAIATLVQKCLLQISSWGTLEMHDLVRDMGREIVRMESPRDPEKRSRLFNPQEVCDVLQGNKGSENVELLMVNDPRALKGVNLSTKVFKKMKNLRVLKIDAVHISGDFEQLPKELRWLSWRRCPLRCIPSKFPLEKLVVLDMRGSDIQEFGLNLQCLRSLKNLDLSGCQRLRRILSVNGSRSLETLNLHKCINLEQLHPSVGDLVKLIHLKLQFCKRLRELPSSICRLKSLKFLNIYKCSSIRTLPVDIGDMRCLQSLLAIGTVIKQLPGSIEMLRDLVDLRVGAPYVKAKWSVPRRRVHCVLSLPTRITSLILRYCGLSEANIPREIGSLSSLETLDLSGNNFCFLPFDFFKLRFLKYLQLNFCENLQTLPSVSDLENLEYFDISSCKKLVNITRLENLPSIMYINMKDCTSLQNPIKEGFFNAPVLAVQSRRERNLLIYLQSNEIPDWCSNQVTASSMYFTMPTHNKEYQFLGMILWCVDRKSVSPPRSCLSIFVQNMSSEFVSGFRIRFRKNHVYCTDLAYRHLLKGR